ncbi:ferritin-like domain-containing protein [Bounagaea algeriensis]
MTRLSDPAAQALRSTLKAEHAAVWLYGLARAHVTERSASEAVDEAFDEHERMRDVADRTLREAGGNAPPPALAYDAGEDVADQTSAIRAALLAERDCQVGWRSVLENSHSPELRRTALDGLTTAATRSTRWRLALGRSPAAPEFPGQP